MSWFGRLTLLYIVFVLVLVIKDIPIQEDTLTLFVYACMGFVIAGGRNEQD